MIERMPDIRILTTKQLAALRCYPTPTVVNALETLGVRDRLNGYSSPAIQCLFPELGAVIGYAATAAILTKSGRVTEIALRRPPTPPDVRFSASGG